MSISSLEKAIVKAANLEHARKYKLADLMEWSSREIKPQEGEETLKVEGYGWATFKLPMPKAQKAAS